MSNPSPDRPVTLEDIAQRASVSRQTVSRALRNHPRHSKATCERIQQLAQEMGYRPNAMVAALMRDIRVHRRPNTSSTLAFVCVLKPGNSVNTEEELLRRSISERAAAFGYGVDELIIHPGEITEARLTQILKARGIRGVILAGSGTIVENLNLIPEYFSIVTCSFSIMPTGFHRVAPDYFGDYFIMIRALEERGYGRIGFVSNQVNERLVGDLWMSAALVHQRKVPTENRVDPLILPGEYTPVWDTLLQDWLRRWKPDCLISTHRYLPELLRRWGWRIPDDLGFAIANYKASFTSSLAGLDQRQELMGRNAVDLLLGQLNRNELGYPPVPKTVIYSGRWIDGNSVRHAKSD